MPFTFYDKINWIFHYIFMGFFFVAGFLFLYLSRKRRKDFRYAAKQLGLTLTEVDEGIRETLASFALFESTEPECVKPLLIGDREDLPLQVFNYHYRKVAGGYEDMLVFGCAVFRLPGQLPELAMVSPPKPADPFASDLLFVDQASLSTDYTLRGDDLAFAKTLITKESAGLFERTPRPQLFLHDGKLLIAQPEGLEADQLAPFLVQALPLARRARELALQQPSEQRNP